MPKLVPNDVLIATDGNGNRVSGALARVYAAGTTTPVTAYADEALTVPLSDPHVANAAGVFAAMYAPEGYYKLDITDPLGASLPGFPQDNILAEQRNMPPSTSPEEFGAVGDGTTDDTAAFLAALATKKRVVCDGSKTYAVDDLRVAGNEMLDLNGATLVPASSACRWIVRLNGFDRPYVGNGYINDNNYVTVKETTIASAATAGDTTFTVADASDFEEGMLIACRGANVGEFVMRQITGISSNTITVPEGIQADIPGGVPVYACFGLVSLFPNPGASMQAPRVDELRLNGGGVHLYQNAQLSAGDISRGTISNIYSTAQMLAQEVIFNNTHDIERYNFQGWGARTLTNVATATAAQTTLDVEATVGTIPIGGVFISDQIGFLVDGVAQTYTSGTPSAGQYTMAADGLTVIFPAMTGGETLKLNIFDRPFTQVLYDPHGVGTVQGANKWTACVYVQNHSCAIFDNANNSGGLIHLNRVNYDAGALFNLHIKNTNKFYGTHVFAGYSPYPLILDLEDAPARVVTVNTLYTAVNTTNHFDSVRVAGAEAITVNAATAAAAKIDGKPKVRLSNWIGPDFSISDPFGAVGVGAVSDRPFDIFERIRQTSVVGTTGLTVSTSNGTVASPAAVTNSDVLWQALINAHDGTDYEPVGNIRHVAAQNHSGSGRASRWEFRSTAHNGTAPSLHSVFRIDGNGFPRIELGGVGGPCIVFGTGDPEGAVPAPAPSIFMREGGGTGTSVYFKETGTGNTGWVAK